MNKTTFLEACATLIKHETRIRALNDYLRKEDAENGEGMFQHLPSTDTPIRRLSINLLALASGVEVNNSIIEYFFDECLNMRNGGQITYPDGTKLALATPEDLWAAVCRERAQKPIAA